MLDATPVEGDLVPAIQLEITLRRLVVNAGASWDTFPGHYDRDYARNNGHQDVFANTSLILAFADRVITDWAGPRTQILRRRLNMSIPVHPGDVLQGQGTVLAVRVDEDRVVMDLRIELNTQRGPCALSLATIEMPALSDIP